MKDDDRWLDELERSLQSYHTYLNVEIYPNVDDDGGSEQLMRTLTWLKGSDVKVTRSRSPRRT